MKRLIFSFPVFFFKKPGIIFIAYLLEVLCTSSLSEDRVHSCVSCTEFPSRKYPDPDQIHLNIINT